MPQTRLLLCATCLAALLGRGATAGDGPPQAPPAAAPAEPDWTVTPLATGAGARVVTVAPGMRPSLEQAFAGARDGDEIRLSPGTHGVTGGNLVLAASGKSDRWIAIRGPAAGAPAVIDLGGHGEVWLAGSYVLLEGVEVVHGGGNNVHVAPRAGDVHDVVVRRCRIHALSSGPGAAIKVNRNNALPAGVERVYLEENDLSEAIGNALIDGVGVRRAVARGNFVHDNARGSHGLFFKGGSSDILVEGNLIRGIRGNAALQLGGSTGPEYFDPAHPDHEGVDQVARNNVVVDCDDSVFEVRGVLRGKIHHNTAITQTAFAILRLSRGNRSGQGSSGNDEIEFQNNLVLSAGGSPQYARNDAGDARVAFGPTLWGGAFSNSGSPGPSIPRFPLPSDVVVGADAFPVVLLAPSAPRLISAADAWARLRPVSKSPALLRGAPDVSLVPRDALGILRSPVHPTLGAVERP